MNTFLPKSRGWVESYSWMSKQSITQQFPRVCILYFFTFPFNKNVLLPGRLQQIPDVICRFFCRWPQWIKCLQTWLERATETWTPRYEIIHVETISRIKHAISNLDCKRCLLDEIRWGNKCPGSLACKLEHALSLLSLLLQTNWN